MTPMPTAAQLAEARAMYPGGTRVKLIRFVDEFLTKLRPGDTGTVTDVDDAGNIHINWGDILPGMNSEASERSQGTKTRIVLSTALAIGIVSQRLQQWMMPHPQKVFV